MFCRGSRTLLEVREAKLGREDCVDVRRPKVCSMVPLGKQ
jgi:hypothetical protein